LEEICLCVTDIAASRGTGMSSGRLGFWVAVILECFEECGVLIANARQKPLAFDDAELS